jgi:hypothetical protein
MRLNAPIQALLALALLLLGPSALTATTRPAHRPAANKRAVHKSAQPGTAAKKRSHKKSTNQAAAQAAPATRTPHSNSHHRRSKKRSADDTPDPITVERAQATPRSAKSRSQIALEAKIARQDSTSVLPIEHRRATSNDFLKAAGAIQSDASASEISVASASELAAPPVTTIPAATRQAPVVNITRARSPKPALEDVSEEAANPVILPTLYNKRGRLIVPPPLKGSHEILVRQNVVADRDGLDRIQNDDDLELMRAQHLLVNLPISRALDVDDRLPVDRRYTRPWTAQFLATLARAHYARFHTSLQVNSAVRTVEFQQRLLRTNGNAAPAEGETASPHLTGQAVDLAKHGLSRTEIAWLRGYLLPLIQQGRIDVEEEFQQSCFHISVYKKYMPSPPPPRREIASGHSSTAALATAIR